MPTVKELIESKISEAGKVCAHYRKKGGRHGECIPGCPEIRLPKGGECPWGEDNEWDEAEDDCPCYEARQ